MQRRGSLTGYKRLLYSIIMTYSNKVKINKFYIVNLFFAIILFHYLLLLLFQSDPFLEIAKAQEGGNYTIVYRSDPVMKNLNPVYVTTLVA